MAFRYFYILFYPVVFVGALLAASLPYPVTDVAAWSPFVCPLRFFTGFLCPSCGLTRACLSIFRGDFAGAMMLNPLSPLVVSSSLIAWLLYSGDLQANFSQWIKKPAPSILLRYGLGIILLWGFARNLI